VRTREQEVAAYTYLTPQEVAEVLKCSAEHVKRLIKKGEIAAVDIGTERRPLYRVAPDVFAAYLQSASVAA
jgi:excisionase family DNA binding protein